MVYDADAMIKALHELCKRGYELPDEKRRACEIAKRAHFLVTCHYPDYRDSFVASAETAMIETIFAVLVDAGQRWGDPSIEALAAFREARLKQRAREENR